EPGQQLGGGGSGLHVRHVQDADAVQCPGGRCGHVGHLTCTWSGSWIRGACTCVRRFSRTWLRLSACGRQYIAYSRRILYEACYPASDGVVSRGRAALLRQEPEWTCTSTRQGNSSKNTASWCRGPR